MDGKSTHYRQMKQHTYFCIDMKSFFASVECAERKLNPMTAKLVVADPSRGEGAICLAVSPKLKQMGVPNRCRLFEIPDNIDYIIAKPQMKKYITYCADIYDVYLNYISPEDIHVYSIDESFIDATDYLTLYGLTAKEFAVKLTNEIATKLHIPSSVGIGSNLYLAKIALDIIAKHTEDRIGILTEETYRETLWHHRPITDFWNVAKGTATRLANYGVFDMEGVTRMPEQLLHKLFGKNYRILLDHAWGRESCTIADIKAYKSKTKSVSTSQILFSDYPTDKARIVMTEMALTMCQELMRRKVIAKNVGIFIGYSKDVIPATGGTTHMAQATNAYSLAKEYVLRLFDKYAEPGVPIRKLGITFSNLSDEACRGYDMFTDEEAIERELRLEHTVLDIKQKFGKNAILRGIDLVDGATAQIRNKLIGGHNGGDEK